MAILQKIRNRSALLIGIIAFALLAFIIQDLFSNGFKSMSNNVGSINGKDIDAEEFRQKVANFAQNGQSNTAQAANQAWENEIAVALFTDQFEKLGIRAGKKHIEEAFKNDQNIGKNPMFLDEAGNFSVTKMNEYLSSNPEQKAYFEGRQKDAELGAKYQVYAALVKGGMFTTEAEGKLKYEMESNKATFDYVAVPYTSVKDSDIKVTDEDYINYMEKRKNRFKSDGSREIEYLLVEDKPSAADEKEIKDRVNALLSGGVVYNKNTNTNDTVPSFKNTTNLSEYLSVNSDKPFDSIYKTKQELNPEHVDKLFALANGEVYGPYMDGKYYCISKMVGRKGNAKAKASHILISWEGIDRVQKKEKRTKEQAQAKAQSLLAQAQANPGMFMMLAMQNSDDSSAQQGGDLGYFAPGAMVKPFNDFVFNNPVGKIGLVESEFGYHIINVTGKEDAVLLATVAQKIDASQETTDKTFTQATKIEMDAPSKDFKSLAKQYKLVENPAVTAKPMDDNFGAIGSQRQIVQWAYSDATNTGDVKRFEIANIGHVIAKLKKVNEKGLMSIEEAKPMIENIIKNKKKAELLLSKIKGNSLEAIAKANNVTVQQAADVTMENPMLPSLGMEQKVVGTAFGLGANKISAAIEGNAGVYVVKTKTITKAPKLGKHDAYVNKLKQVDAGAVGRVAPALKAKADISDNRAKFF